MLEPKDLALAAIAAFSLFFTSPGFAAANYHCFVPGNPQAGEFTAGFSQTGGTLTLGTKPPLDLKPTQNPAIPHPNNSVLYEIPGLASNHFFYYLIAPALAFQGGRVIQVIWVVQKAHTKKLKSIDYSCQLL